MSFESYRIQPILVIVSLYVISLDHNPVTPRADTGICESRHRWPSAMPVDAPGTDLIEF